MLQVKSSPHGSKGMLLPNGLLGAILGAVCLQVFVLDARSATLSDNLNQLTSYTELISGPDWIAAGFGTGSAASTLATVTLLMQTDNPGASLSLDLFSTDAEGRPMNFLGQLSSPSSYTSSLSQAAFGGAGLALAANSSYWLVAEAPAGQFEWAYTASNQGSGVGFQHTWGYSDDAGATWFTSDLAPMQMRVEDSASAATPEPAPFAFLLLATLFLGLLSGRRSLAEVSKTA